MTQDKIRALLLATDVGHDVRQVAPLVAACMALLDAAAVAETERNKARDLAARGWKMAQQFAKMAETRIDRRLQENFEREMRRRAK